MTTKNDRLNEPRDLERILIAHDCPIRNGGGSHRVATLPDGSKLTYADHGEFGPATRCALRKTLLALGFLALVAMCVIGTGV